MYVQDNLSEWKFRDGDLKVEQDLESKSCTKGILKKMNNKYF